MLGVTFLLIILANVFGDVYVDRDSSCDDDCDGSESAPYKTIQEALDDVSNNQGVLTISDGTYTGDGNVNLSLSNSFSTIRGENSASKTIIDCENNGYFGILLDSGTFTIEDISVVNCNAANQTWDYNGEPFQGIWGMFIVCI